MKKLLALILFTMLVGCETKKPASTVVMDLVDSVNDSTIVVSSSLWRDTSQGVYFAHSDTIIIHDTIIKRKTIYLDTCVDIHLAPDIITEVVPPGFARIPKDSAFDWGNVVDSIYKSKGLKPPHDDNDKPLNIIKL